MSTRDPKRTTDDVSGTARPAATHPDVSPEEPRGREREPAGAPAPTDGHQSEAAEGEDLALEPQHDVGAAPERHEPPPLVVADLAAACVRFVAARYRVTLDYAPDTLSLLDEWVREARAERKSRAELTDLVQSTAGAYLGEVIRRALGGAWQIADDDIATWRLCLSTVYCRFNPIGMVREALTLAPADDWHAHFELDPAERESVEQRLLALPPVDEAEYYAPSTRFDVVAIVVQALRAQMEARGLGDVFFGLEDYA